MRIKEVQVPREKLGAYHLAVALVAELSCFVSAGADKPTYPPPYEPPEVVAKRCAGISAPGFAECTKGVIIEMAREQVSESARAEVELALIRSADPKLEDILRELLEDLESLPVTAPKRIRSRYLSLRLDALKDWGARMQLLEEHLDGMAQFAEPVYAAKVLCSQGASWLFDRALETIVREEGEDSESSRLCTAQQALLPAGPPSCRLFRDLLSRDDLNRFFLQPGPRSAPGADKRRLVGWAAAGLAETYGDESECDLESLVLGLRRRSWADGGFLAYSIHSALIRRRKLTLEELATIGLADGNQPNPMSWDQYWRLEQP